jgi:hypothetical protein
MSHTATTELYLLGTYWCVEIDFYYDAYDNVEELTVEEVWLVGYYPEPDGKEYVSCRIKANRYELTQEEEKKLEDAVRRYIAAQAREEFDDHHGYED